MGRLERFLRLERARPDRKDSSGGASLDRFRDPPPVPPADADPEDAAGPRSCAECGAENNPVAATCFNCAAELDTPQMRAHQERERRRARQEAEQRRRETEELAEREIEKLRRESRSRREPEPPAPGPAQHPPLDFQGASPLLWVLRSLGGIADPWYRFGARLAVIAAFVGLVAYAMSSPARYPFFLLAVLLLGGGGLRGRRRWDRWR